jgi:SAM-dependent methyltransferase
MNSQGLLIGATMGWQDQLQEGMKLPERSGSLADDPFRGRHPTSHERMAGLPWDASYQDGRAPWDIGQPQPAIVRLASEGGFAGTVLDAGCGTGENALLAASLGLSVLGVDVAETALAIAREKVSERGIEVEFAAADAFHLDRLGRMFDTVLDCGLFHTFDGDERPGYAASLASAIRHDGTLYVLCFSDDGPDTGPHPIRHRTGPDSDEIPRRRRTGLVRDNQTDLACGDWSAR